MSRLTRVTITGADDKVCVGELQQLSRDYPFVEWGLLLSMGRMGTPRYPSMSTVAAAHEAGLRVAHHLCGSFARKACEEHAEYLTAFSWLTGLPQRIQLNGITIEKAIELLPLGAVSNGRSR